MRRIEYFAPETVDEAVALLGRYGESVSILAGGTDLLVEIKHKVRTPDQLVNIKKIAGLVGLTYKQSAGLRIGVLTTVRAVETSQVIQEKYAGVQCQCPGKSGSLFHPAA